MPEDVRPPCISLHDSPPGVRHELIPCPSIEEKVELLLPDQPNVWITSGRRTARQGDRIIAAETRFVVAGMIRESGPISRIAETPDHIAVTELKIRPAGCCGSIDEIGDRIEAIYRKAGSRIGNHPFSDGGESRAARPRNVKQ